MSADVTEYFTLQFCPMPSEGGEQPPSTPCIFSDGFSTNRYGWWSRSEQQLYVPTAHGNDVISHEEFKWWAPMSNLQGFNPVRNAVPGIEQ